MIVRWSHRARADVDRLAEFAVAYSSDHADEIERKLSQAPKDLLQFPRRGSRLNGFEPREVREFRTGDYLLRYELAEDNIFVLRFFHGRENRF